MTGGWCVYSRYPGIPYRRAGRLRLGGGVRLRSRCISLGHIACGNAGSRGCLPFVRLLIRLRFLRVIHADVQFKADSGVSPSSGEEWHGARSRRDLVICRELGYGQHFGPVVLELVDITAQVLLHGCTDSLSLAICLWVEGGRKARLYSQTVTKIGPEA